MGIPSQHVCNIAQTSSLICRQCSRFGRPPDVRNKITVASLFMYENGMDSVKIYKALWYHLREKKAKRNMRTSMTVMANAHTSVCFVVHQIHWASSSNISSQAIQRHPRIVTGLKSSSSGVSSSVLERQIPDFVMNAVLPSKRERPKSQSIGFPPSSIRTLFCGR